MTLIVIGAWVAAFIAIAGLGQWVRLAFRLTAGGVAGWLRAFWVGYVVLIAVLQCQWLFGPITWLSTAIIGVVGLAGAVVAVGRGIRALLQLQLQLQLQPIVQRGPLRGTVARALIGLAFLTALAVIAGWVANRALDPRIDFDSQFYHISAIRWRNEYPAILGLGNLHYRLAFNQSFFLYCAWLNVFPDFGHGYTLANSLLLMVTAATCLEPFFSLLGRRAQHVPAEHAGAISSAIPYRWIPILAAALCLPIVVYRAVPQPYSHNISGPSPDLGVYLFQIIIALSALDLLFGRAPGSAPALKPGKHENGHENHFALFLITGLGAVSVTQKLSAAAFGAALITMIGIWWWVGRRSSGQNPIRSAINTAALIMLAALPVLIPWLVIGLITSGYPAFPNTFGALPVDFRIPPETTVEARDWIYSWARYPVSSANAAEVLSGWFWLPLWLRLLFSDPTELFLFAIPVLLFAVLMAAWAVKLIVKAVTRQRAYPRAIWVVVLPALIGAAFWWVTAPDPRFAGAVFWLLAIGAAALLIGAAPRLAAALSLCGLLITGWIVADGYANSWADRPAFPTVYSEPVVPYVTQFGFTYNVSADSDRNLQMGDPPLPSSVYRMPGVALRGKTLLDGLVTRPTPTPTP